MAPLLARAANIGAEETDDDARRLEKSLLVICAFPFALVAFLWAGVYAAYGEYVAAAIPASYACFSLLSVGYFALTRNFKVFRFSQLSLILLLPFLVTLALGGLVSGSLVILWALISPLGALLFDEPRRAPRWFIAFAALVVTAGVSQPWLRDGNLLPTLLVRGFFVMNLLGVGGLVFFMVYYFVGQKNVFQARADQLLLNILPPEIAAILKREHRVIADSYAGASILFADMVNFTPMTAGMTPVQIVELLNEIFSAFDGLVERYGLEKIKTIGDCYMVASGVPRPRADHAQALVRLALEMRNYLNSATFNGAGAISFRMGINSGAVVAGVIGRKKFIYDLWGDSVNTASRMESHGAAGVIQISRATYDLVKDEFVCEPRGTVAVKGKGEMEVWQVSHLAEKQGNARPTHP